MGVGQRSRGEMWSDARCILKAEPLGFADRPEENGSEGGGEIWGLNN